MLGGYLDFLWLFLLGGVVIAITRFLLIQGIQWASDAWEIPRKVQGQILGYATSAPELVGTLGTASKGLIGAGLWNVAASNIINLLLFTSAALYYKRSKMLVQRKFIDEAGFALGAIAIPCLLVLNEDFARSPYAAGGLFLYFVSYLVLDKVFNPKEEEDDDTDGGVDTKQGAKGIAFIVLGLLGIIITGNFLGTVAESIVTQLHVPEWAVGWILGVITSLPELTSFYAVFAASKASEDDEDCQQNLDNLAASNMSNVGLIYPLGILVFLLVT